MRVPATMRAASISRALSRSTAVAYSRTCSDEESRRSISAASIGAIREAGGIRRVAKGGVGTPFGDSTVTRASPIPSDVSVV
jgi:hypothetical protein